MLFLYCVYLFCLVNQTIANDLYYSQCGQDTFVHKTFFKNKHDGIFVDIGAHDGITFSNTYFFEKELGWAGICIEPMPYMFEKLQNNRSCICIHGCIAEKNTIAPFLFLDGPSNMLSGLLTEYDPRHMKRIFNELYELGGSIKILKMNCIALNDLLEQYGFYTVDYLSIDTEGNELKILQSIDFNRFSIHIIDVENNYNIPDIGTFLATKGYRKITQLGGDEIYEKINKSIKFINVY